MKRRSDQVDDLEVAEKGKRRAPSHQDRFREGLFGGSVLDEYRRSYATSKPYRHGVIQSLISPALLRSVRSEIQNLSFTPKETDIYKIHQSGDLANLDGLDDSSLKLLPSLLTLRDAMYSSDFREYLSTVTDSGPLSGKKTDMAINVYTPGCHLLCHDDVIGSRRVSYILYLTDPDTPWKEEWGGALRLYPTQTYTEDDGEVTKVPSPDYSVSIPPAFNQLSFFAVQPGESFHDVQEVYAEDEEIDKEKAGGRARMAISGWYHIPQEGEDGYVEGLEERLADKSSLMQLQGKGDKYELPKSNFELYKKSAESSGDIGLPTPSSQEDPALSEEDLNFLLKYIAPTYLTPDTLESVSGIFAEEFSLCLDTFLSHKFSDSVRDYIESQESQTLPSESTEIEKTTSWAVARPPHKHHFLFQKASSSERRESPLLDLLEDLLPSEAFQKWLSLATGQTIMSHNLLVRRFRRGRDYTLATGYEEHAPRIELCLSITPTSGWGDDENAESEKDTNKEVAVKEKDEAEEITTTADEPSVGGYLAYMAGEDEDDPDHDEGGSDHGVEVPFDMSTGARSTRAANPKKSKQDPAIYQASGDDDEDGVLFSMPAGWNRLGIVLRDKGTMRFVKYVSRMAKGDRWDLVGEFDVLDDESDEEDDKGKVNETGVRSEADDGTHEDEDDDDSDDNHEDSSTEHSD
ncbi:hypothetical protein HO173_005413 [Letharia columbiana]|uniref:uS12 prolyl 3,4-dihydroxylase n=1 Tax=Letharia columbiana TaxID=112416 RepID=A0A8H6FXQ4_9LECA|nr:uncharacterized protein HO173_005413 [Letharia columbiana]KAF6236632.1 hypothetical protein HO173_005413 [Letharia columbiana]